MPFKKIQTTTTDYARFQSILSSPGYFKTCPGECHNAVKLSNLFYVFKIETNCQIYTMYSSHTCTVGTAIYMYMYCTCTVDYMYMYK